MSERRYNFNETDFLNTQLDPSGQTPRNFILPPEIIKQASAMLDETIRQQAMNQQPTNTQPVPRPTATNDSPALDLTQPMQVWIVATLQKLTSERTQDSQQIKAMANQVDSLQAIMNSVPLNSIPALAIKVDELYKLHESSEKHNSKIEAQLVIITGDIAKMLEAQRLSLEKTVEKKDTELKEVKSRMVTILLAIFAALVSVFTIIVNLLNKK
jgi:hypothetical protein